MKGGTIRMKTKFFIISALAALLILSSFGFAYNNGYGNSMMNQRYSNAYNRMPVNNYGYGMMSGNSGYRMPVNSGYRYGMMSGYNGQNSGGYGMTSNYGNSRGGMMSGYGSYGMMYWKENEKT